MKNKTLFVSLAVVVVLLAGVGFYLVNQSQTGGSSAPNYAVAGDQNYAVAIGSKTLSPITLGSITASTSSATTTVSLQRGLSYGLNLGNTCAVQLSSATSTLGWSADAQITAIASQNATATVTFFNGSTAATTVSTGTLKVICQNY